MASRTSEGVFNAVLAGVLRDRHPRWGGSAVLAEATGVLRGAAARQPDILVTGEGGAPVVIETEYEPASSVESDAISRLGAIIDTTGSAVAAVLAVRVPLELRGLPGGHLSAAVSDTTYRYCCHTMVSAASDASESPQIDRFPATGWLSGGVDDIAALVERVRISEAAISEGAILLERGVKDAAAILDNLATRHPSVLARVAELLRQEDGEQTRRMAMAICANALVFQTAVAGTHPEIVDPSDPSLCSLSGSLSKRQVLAAWSRILNINYWPIFAVASDIVAAIPTAAASEVLERLAEVAEGMTGLGAVTTGDLAGQMFGRLISDRKFLATFYTRPASATLLAELAVSRLTCDFTTRAEVVGLRLADLACGTGALLSAVYGSVAARYRRKGGDDEALHSEMMETCLIAADIMPAATHLTASLLSGMHPSVPFGNTRVYTMPYGRQSSHRPAAIGSLELLGNEQVLSLFGTGRAVASGGGERPSEDVGTEADVADASLDVVIMNPPFTRSTNHEGAASGVPRPAFAGFDTSETEQREMAERLDNIHRGMKVRAGHGNAGLASNFIDLAHAKVKPGGVVAFVLPAAVASGGAWQAAREVLRDAYSDALVVSIASSGSTDRAFSADTGMAEALVVATRKADRKFVVGDDVVVWVSLKERPRDAVAAAETARAITEAAGQAAEAAKNVAVVRPRSDSDAVTASGASGKLQLGDEVIGCYALGGWGDGGCVGVANPDVIEAAACLASGVLRLPGRADQQLPLVSLAELGERGLYHLDIAGPALSKTGVPRGPFDIDPLPWNQAPPSFPVLWHHDAKRERRLVVHPDSQGKVRHGRRDHALEVWAKATRLHVNLDFRLNSQSLAACLTPGKAVGGRAWPNYRLKGADPEELVKREQFVTLWMNTTLGLIAFWWLGTRQQQGRAVLTITRIGDMIVADPRCLLSQQTDMTSEIFDELAECDLQPAHEAASDTVRHRLDEAVLCQILGLPGYVLEALAVLRAQWCAEPSVHGGKARRG